MKIGIVGNREGWDYTNEFLPVIKTFNISFEEDIIISGGADGIDNYAGHYARNNGIELHIIFPRPIGTKGRTDNRFFDRNKKIAEACDVLIAFDKKEGASGTKNTIRYAKELGKKVIRVKARDNIEYL